VFLLLLLVVTVSFVLVTLYYKRLLKDCKSAKYGYKKKWQGYKKKWQTCVNDKASYIGLKYDPLPEGTAGAAELRILRDIMRHYQDMNCVPEVLDFLNSLPELIPSDSTEMTCEEAKTLVQQQLDEAIGSMPVNEVDKEMLEFLKELSFAIVDDSCNKKTNKMDPILFIKMVKNIVKSLCPKLDVA